MEYITEGEKWDKFKKHLKKNKKKYIAGLGIAAVAGGAGKLGYDKYKKHQIGKDYEGVNYHELSPEQKNQIAINKLGDYEGVENHKLSPKQQQALVVNDFNIKYDKAQKIKRIEKEALKKKSPHKEKIKTNLQTPAQKQALSDIKTRQSAKKLGSDYEGVKNHKLSKVQKYILNKNNTTPITKTRPYTISPEKQAAINKIKRDRTIRTVKKYGYNIPKKEWSGDLGKSVKKYVIDTPKKEWPGIGKSIKKHVVDTPKKEWSGIGKSIKKHADKYLDRLNRGQ